MDMSGNTICMKEKINISEKYYLILLSLFLLYIGIGIFPLYCYESDSMHLIMGCSIICNQGFTIPPIYQYEYDMQPMAYILLPCIRHILPFLTCENIYCLLTGVATLLFIPVTIKLINYLTNLPKTIILLSLFLLPETMAIAMYPNTAILALCPAIFGIYAMFKNHYKTAVLLMGLAPLFRVDILILYPIVLFIFLYQDCSFKESLKKTFIIGICISVIILLGFIVLHANPLDSTLKGYESWNNRTPFSQNIIAMFSFYDVINLILLPIGIVFLYKKKKYKLLMISLIPILLNHFVYRKMGCATKHYLYMLPFVAILTGIGINYIRELLKSRNIIRYISICCILLFIFGSVRIDYPNRPWLNAPVSESRIGPFACLFSENRTPYKIKMGIGAGMFIRTLDEYMLLSGNAFYPLYIHNLKKQAVENREKAYCYLKNKNYNLWGYIWEMKANLPLFLLDKGYSYHDCSDGFVLTKGKQKVHVYLDDDPSAVINLKEREMEMKKRINSLRMKGFPFYAFCSFGTDRFMFDGQVKSGNISKITETLYYIPAIQKDCHH